MILAIFRQKHLSEIIELSIKSRTEFRAHLS